MELPHPLKPLFAVSFFFVPAEKKKIKDNGISTAGGGYSQLAFADVFPCPNLLLKVVALSFCTQSSWRNGEAS